MPNITTNHAIAHTNPDLDFSKETHPDYLSKQFRGVGGKNPRNSPKYEHATLHKPLIVNH